MPSTAPLMSLAPATLSSDRKLVRDAIVSLDLRLLDNYDDITAFLRTYAREIVEDRGVDTSHLPKKTYRRIVKRAFRSLDPFLAEGGVAKYRRGYVLASLENQIERLVHCGHLPLKPDAKLGFCHFAGCVLKCPRTVPLGSDEFGVSAVNAFNEWHLGGGHE